VKHFRKHISVVLLLAVSVFILPRPLIHEFFHHDTEDAIISHSGETAVGNAHEHCDLLELNSPPFQHNVTAFTFCVSFCNFTYAVLQDDFYCKGLATSQYLRGPPLV